MTTTAVLALIATQHCVPEKLAPLMAGIAMHESGGDPNAVRRNPNGTSDFGLSQVNSSNFGWLGLTAQSALDPCRNLAAGLKVLFARYNGSPPPEVARAYAAGVTASIQRVDASAPPPPARPDATGRNPCEPDDPDDWHTAARPAPCFDEPQPKDHPDEDK